MRIKSLPQAVKEAQKSDPKTAINKFMLASLISEKKIPHGNHGNRTVVDYDLIIPAINVIKTDIFPLWAKRGLSLIIFSPKKMAW